jgi:hypothetical protein
MESNISKEPTNTIRYKLLYYNKDISIVLGVLCVIVILYTIHGFSENQRHDGSHALVINLMSYITTSMALITALLFLN